MRTKKFEQTLSRHFAAMYAAADDAERARLAGSFHRTAFLKKNRLILVASKGAVLYEVVDLRLYRQKNTKGARHVQA